jgi:hypothetical protein
MLLEEETYKKFGYYARDLAPKSNKSILAACDECGKIREMKKSQYRAFCRSCARKGEKHFNFGKHLSVETRRKIGKANKDKPLMKKLGRKRGRANRGRRHSEATKKRMGDALRGEKNHNYGKHLSVETRRKLSEINKGKQHSKETREKMRDGR